jgi:hypothetical protein
VTPEAERDEGDGRHGDASVPTAPTGELDEAARRILEDAWRIDPVAGGFCVPNAATYPWQWLWDSCFHAVVWSHLGDERAELELRAALSAQDADGFVPHLRYVHGANPHADLWGHPTASSITQPPMYGHAIAVLHRAGHRPADDLVERASEGLRFLLAHRRRTAGGLVELCHPWESGCDDSPRWDDAVGEGWSPDAWFEAKGALLAGIERSASGAPLANPAFAVGSVGFSALVAWNALELVEVTGEDDLRTWAVELVGAVDARWDGALLTWVDDGPTASGSGRVRTIDALLPQLVAPRGEAFTQVTDAAAFGGRFGPAGVHRDEPTFAPTTYWRGPAWPQLSYLLWVASRRSGHSATATALQASLVGGALASAFSEYWEPDSGAPLGAAPQSWTALACVVASP